MHSDLTCSTPTQTTLAVALTAPDHRLAAVNDAFAELLGYTPQELCGRTFESITHWPDAALDSDLADQLFAGQIPSYEIGKRYVHKDGSLVTILLQVSTVRDGKGRITFAVVQARPVAETESFPAYQHPASPSDEIEKIKRAMFR